MCSKQVRLIGAAITLLVVLLIAGGMIPLSRASQPSSSPITILFTHDLHSNLQSFMSYDQDNQTTDAGGYARLATAVANERQISPGNTILLDAGDFTMGTLFHTLITTEAAELRVMGELGYAATTIGNHEFDFDSSALAQSLLTAKKHSGSKLPAIVASNLAIKPESNSGIKEAASQYGIKDYTIIAKQGLRIGVFGIIGKNAVHDIILAQDIEFKDPTAEAKRVVKLLKEKEKVDVIICLSHSGTYTDKEKSEDELLAAAVPDIDLIISGHTHTLLPQPIMVGNTVIASAGCYGEYLGKLDFISAPGQKPVLIDYQLIPISKQWAEDKKIDKEIGAYKELVNSQFLSRYHYEFNQVMAESSFDMGSLDIMYKAASENGLGDLVADSFRDAVARAEGSDYQYVNLAVEPLGLIRSSFTAGNIEVKDVFRTLSLGMGTDKIPGYPLVAFYLTGSDIKNCLEIQSTLAPREGNYNMQVSGVKFKYNPYRVPLDRVYGITISMPDGTYQPLQKDRLYRVTTSYYAAALLAKMGPMTHGIVNAAPKDKSGQRLTDLNQALVDISTAEPGVQELKEWIALSQYLQSFKDIDNNGVANIPVSYQRSAGRYQAAASLNPYYLLVDATRITWLVIGAGITVILLLYLGGRVIKRRVIKRSKAA